MLSPIDMPTAVARLGGDKQLFYDFAQSVLDEAPSMRETIRVALSDGDFETAHLTAHGLKGMLATLEARPATAAAADVEKLSYERRLDEAISAAEQLSGELDRLQAVLRDSASAR
jgi:HPt (histidine-containing phosphotransfer) domain-containing protein